MPEVNVAAAAGDGFDDLRRKLAERREATAWRPEKPGEELAGVVERVEWLNAMSGRRCPVVVLRTPDGLRAVWASSAVLRRLVDETRPAAGERVLFAYGGRVQSKSGRDYHSYSLIVDRDESEPGGSPADVSDAPWPGGNGDGWPSEPAGDDGWPSEPAGDDGWPAEPAGDE